MRRFVLVVVTLACGAAMDLAAQCVAPSAAAATAAVRVLNQQYIDAARDGDAAWFDRHLADDVVVVLGGGARILKPEFLSRVRARPTSYRSMTVRDVTVRAFGTTVQVDADAPWERLDGTRGVSRYIDTWAWLDCRWQVISAQITLLPQADGRE